MAAPASRDTVLRNNLMFSKESVTRRALFPDLARKFIASFEKRMEPAHPVWGHRKYKAMLQEAANGTSETVLIDLNDLEEFAKQEEVEPDDEICRNRGVSKKELQEAAQKWIPDLEKCVLPAMKHFQDACSKEMVERDPNLPTGAQEVTARWREQMIEEQHAGNPEAIAAAKAGLPMRLKNPFDIRFKPRDSSKGIRMRELQSQAVGALVELDCMVVRSAPVKPRMEVVTYHCEACHGEVFMEVQGDRFKPLKECPSQRCKDNKSPGRLQQMIRTSKFTKFQEIRVQEMSAHVPVGGVPRGMTVLATGDLCRQVLPGDSVTITGIYKPTEQPRWRGNNGVQTMHIEAHHIQKHKSGYNEKSLNSEELERQVEEAIKEGNIYEQASRSIAPEIFGHEDVKKALLLVLIGSFTETMKDGMKIRGDIHALLMGDPGVAKSQLIKQVCNIAPRAIYTTGKGSSGVGLTATVIRDNATGEVTLEGGALVLADTGICCIDEFDKMEEADRTAIHEVMEQQSVSLAKNGITTTLNCRTTVLAAANPADGRYDSKKSPVENINLPPALLSRFDLLFLLLDTVDMEKDKNLARHVTKVHCCYDAKKAESAVPQEEMYSFKAFNAEFLRTYISKARQLKPLIEDELMEDIVSAYVAMRQEETVGDRDERKSYTTPRTLLAILRLSQAHARARLSNRVDREDFDEAIRLMKASKESVELSAPAKKGKNPVDLIYDIVADLHRQMDPSSEGQDVWVDMGHVVSLASHKNFTKEQVEEGIAHWESVNVLYRSPDQSKVKFFVPPATADD
eukprot:CAMPEP_0206447104 /NCGR_PEP_ID=MMETSP0324_2-20121206/16571_1 /ASSEMBLY_ACC=CAM_ASM_000836 /TAXON_ID=2866 /ORGANISM="Crypthecodinium cohnii, Strain Seligo" /LENGTH=795 /DNA_ID=CAMNT_0053915779 /DNA_START=131 /DNA_END=2518 /DNA_ORIENTATION=+